MHNLANKQASKSQQTAGIVLLSLLATDARYLKTLKQPHTHTHTHTYTHDAYATWYVLQAKPALLSLSLSLWLVCESLKVNNLKASGVGGTRSLRHLNHINRAKRNGLCSAQLSSAATCSCCRTYLIICHQGHVQSRLQPLQLRLTRVACVCCCAPFVRKHL